MSKKFYFCDVADGVAAVFNAVTGRYRLKQRNLANNETDGQMLASFMVGIFIPFAAVMGGMIAKGGAPGWTFEALAIGMPLSAIAAMHFYTAYTASAHDKREAEKNSSAGPEGTRPPQPK